MNKWVELIIGLVLIAVSIVVPIYFHLGEAVKQFIIGGVIVFMFLLGLLFLAIAISDMRD